MTSNRAIPAVYMRGGTSKGVFFHERDLPADPAERDRLLLRIVGSPDRYGRQIDGMGGGTSSTSKVVLIGPAGRSDSDVAYRFGAVAIDAPVIDWSGNCGNLTSAVGPFAIDEGLVGAPADGVATVRLWQANLGKRIIAHVPVRGGRAWEPGEFQLDGVAFPSAEIKLEFIDPAGEDEGGGGLFPTGRLVEPVLLADGTKLEATLINAGNPLIVVAALALGLEGTETPARCNADRALLARCEAVRARGAVLMGLAANEAEATAKRPHTPKLAFVSSPQACEVAGGRTIPESAVDLTARIVSMGQIHHAITGTGAVGLAVAAAIPGTIAARCARNARPPGVLRLGHASGVMEAVAEVRRSEAEWQIARVVMSRSARRLMQGSVLAPDPAP